jgi:hypothetical protein
MAAKTGVTHHHAKLTPDLVRQMREWYAEGSISFLELACEFDIAESTCREAVQGRTWADVPAVIVKTCHTCHGKGRVPV